MHEGSVKLYKFHIEFCYVTENKITYYKPFFGKQVIGIMFQVYLNRDFN